MAIEKTIEAEAQCRAWEAVAVWRSLATCGIFGARCWVVVDKVGCDYHRYPYHTLEVYR